MADISTAEDASYHKIIRARIKSNLILRDILSESQHKKIVSIIVALTIFNY